MRKGILISGICLMISGFAIQWIILDLMVSAVAGASEGSTFMDYICFGGFGDFGDCYQFIIEMSQAGDMVIMAGLILTIIGILKNPKDKRVDSPLIFISGIAVIIVGYLILAPTLDYTNMALIIGLTIIIIGVTKNRLSSQCRSNEV